jgi:hypothetical protein
MGRISLRQPEGKVVAKARRLTRLVAVVLVLLAVLSGLLLLAKDAGITALRTLPSSEVSAAPLLLVGVAFLIAQLIIRPNLADLLKNILLAATFLLWGAVQLMPLNALSARLGNLVIALYVVDLAWAIVAKLYSTARQTS